MSNTKNAPWVVAGGKIGEIGHCTRCGEGLNIGPQPLGIIVAAMKAFAEIHRSCKEGDAPVEKPVASPYDWIKSRDTGVSSATIFAVLANTASPYGKYDIPYDPADFGRCYRLLTLFPEWKTRISEVVARFPFWAPYVREWDKMTELFEEESNNADRTAPKLYVIMKELEAEAKLLKNGKLWWTDADAIRSAV